MIYRTYRAPTYREAVTRARMELGNAIYIIGRKEVKEGGFLGLFSKRLTEITVARYDESDGDVPEKKASVLQKQSNSSRGAQVIGSKSREVLQPEGVTLKGEAQKSGSGTFQGDGVVVSAALLSEIREMKLQLQKVISTQAERSARGNHTLNRLAEVLRINDFSDDYIERMRGKFETELSYKDVQNPEILETRVKNYILDSIDLAGPIEIGKDRSRIVVLVGPTGVGKTTTIAKLAASFGVLQKRRVELFTIDSYRIAAIEQLGKYAELMQLPFTVINSREEFKNAVMNSKAELIFVDTVGRSQRNNLGLAELRDILDGAKAEIDVHLVISATTKFRDAIDIVTRFRQLMYGKVIISKLDETNTIGSVISALQGGMKLSYFTTGQGVPDDIEIARKEKLFEMITLEGLRQEEV
ncbi:MAG: flagellar biosynthesis protein FlhF [Spirochaetota bacterium]